MNITLWMALAFLTVMSVLPKTYHSRFLLGGSGWVFLSIYWFLQPASYVAIQDYFNGFLAGAAGMVSLFIAYIAFQAGIEKKSSQGNGIFLISFSRAASVSGLIYFLFADVKWFNTGIISMVTNQTIWVVEQLGFPVSQVAWNQLAVNGLAVEIILACTAIESMALFTGVISSASGAPVAQRFRALMISVPVVYVLNLLRVAFTASAYGFGWFGTPEESFQISEHGITKIGSILALFLISYMVLKTLPQVLDMIDGMLKMMRIEFRRLIMGVP